MTAVLALLLVAGAAGPALAESWHASEPRRDVRWYSIDPDPAPCGTVTTHVARRDRTTDITGLSVHHDRTVVRVAVRFRDLAARGRQWTEFTLKTDAGFYLVDISRRRSEGSTHADVSAFEPPDHADECGSYSFGALSAGCPGFDAVIDAELDRITTRIPRDCLGSPRWVRAAATTRRPRNDHSDSWQPAGVKVVEFVGALGPRVRRD